VDKNDGTIALMAKWVEQPEDNRMSTRYNLISVQNLGRLAALSDGIFAVAMTLLVLDLRVPLNSTIQSKQALWDTLVQLAPRFLTYLIGNPNFLQIKHLAFPN
jgi:uncharacterized membrane protein